MTISSKNDDLNYFKQLLFFNVPIEKPKIKHVKNVDLLGEQPFYDQLKSYKVGIVDKKDLIVQLEASKSSIKDLFNDLLNETKGFKYQITVKFC